MELKRSQLEIPELKIAADGIEIAMRKPKATSLSVKVLMPQPRPASQLHDHVPSLPPRSPIGRHPRAVSDTFPSTSERRSIFGDYWTPESVNNLGKSCKGVDKGARSSSMGTDSRSNSSSEALDGEHPTLTNTRSPTVRHSQTISFDILDACLEPEEARKNYRMYAPPKDHAQRSPICGRFTSVREITFTNPILESLPPLPTPLLRLCSDGKTPGSLQQGMYPMTTPIPILRPSSFRSFQSEDMKKTESMIDGRSSPLSEDDLTTSTFNLTNSWRPDHKLAPFRASSSIDMRSTEESSSIAESIKHGVRFDPRITVSEFEDPIERVWYDDAELDRLKHETILVAHRYLFAHPDQAELYNCPWFDAVTGTYRKKALFSLPVLSTTNDTDECTR